MIFFPNAKINLGLNVISKKNNGYHNLESCFCPINLFDIIEIKKSDSSSFRTSGIKIPGKSKENIILDKNKCIHFANRNKMFIAVK